MNPNILRLIRKKRRLWKYYKTTKEYANYQAFLEIQKAVAKSIRSAKRKLERKLAKNLKKNPRAFYSHLNKSIKSRSQVGPLKTEKGELVSDNEGMCNTLNSFFASMFTIEDMSVIPTPEMIYQGEESASTFIIDKGMVIKKIDKLKINSAPGPDMFSPRLLHELQEHISLPLSIIFNKSLLEGEVPLDWKNAYVTPIFKKGSRAVSGNYRPISLTSVICKVMESLLCDFIMSHLSRYKLIKSSQHGFLPHRSCLTNLLEYLERLTTLLGEGYNVDVFYLDLSKAFDRVPHQRLLLKLTSHGIDGDIYRWIKSWLSDRKQSVILNGSHSSWQNVSSGVPQGSVLGPLLFIIFINDIDLAVDTLHTALSKFADDTKGVRQIITDEDAQQLQKDLDNLFKWSIDWQMLFNLDKCHILHLGKSNPCHTYTLNGHSLEAVNEEKDLGVIIDSTCTPSKQVGAAALKGNQVLGQLLRAFTYRDHDVFIMLYKQYVRPHLEYCIQAWSPWLKQDAETLENVQRRAVNSVSGLHGNYEEKLLTLGLPSLVQRRKRGDMIQTFKMIRQIDDIDPSIFFKFSTDCHEHATRLATIINEDDMVCPAYGLTAGPSSLELRRNFFSQRVVSHWNALPSNVQMAPSVNSFKQRYDTLQE